MCNNNIEINVFRNMIGRSEMVMDKEKEKYISFLSAFISDEATIPFEREDVVACLRNGKLKYVNMIESKNFQDIIHMVDDAIVKCRQGTRPTDSVFVGVKGDITLMDARDIASIIEVEVDENVIIDLGVIITDDVQLEAVMLVA